MNKKDFQIILPLSVVFSNKLILVVDASCHINPYVTKRGLKLDSLDEFSFLVQKDDFLVVNDLDSGYWHVPLHPSQYPLFGVSIYDELEKKTHYYQWIMLFLGLSDAVHIFTKLLLPVVKHLRSCGWEGNFYKDNLCTLGTSY